MGRRKQSKGKSSGLTLKQGLFGLVALLLLSAALVFGWPSIRAHLQAIAVLKQVSHEPVPWIVGEATSDPITTEDIQLPLGVGSIRGRLYLPTDRPDAPGLVVFHGVHYLGMDEPRLEAFAAALASSGLRVLTPELPDIKDYHIDAASVQTIGESASWFSSKTGAPVGVMGLSFSGGLALLAAANSHYQPSFKFVFAVGSQDSMEHVASYYLSGRETLPDGTIEQLAPHEYGVLVLEYEHLEDFLPAEDIEPVRAVLRQHLYEDKAAEQRAMALLSPAQVEEARRLMDSNSAATRAMLAKTNAKHIAEMQGLSPASVLQQIHTPVYLLHGQADNIIPAAETAWLAHGLAHETLKGALVSPVLSHLDVESAKPGAWDEWQLVHLLAKMLEAAEKK